MARTKRNKPVVTATDRARKAVTDWPSPTHNEIAQHAYQLYLARNCQHGHDVEDWLQAERELRGARSSAGA